AFATSLSRGRAAANLLEKCLVPARRSRRAPRVAAIPCEAARCFPWSREIREGWAPYRPYPCRRRSHPASACRLFPYRVVSIRRAGTTRKKKEKPLANSPIFRVLWSSSPRFAVGFGCHGDGRRV